MRRGRTTAATSATRRDGGGGPRELRCRPPSVPGGASSASSAVDCDASPVESRQPSLVCYDARPSGCVSAEPCLARDEEHVREAGEEGLSDGRRRCAGGLPCGVLEVRAERGEGWFLLVCVRFFRRALAFHHVHSNTHMITYLCEHILSYPQYVRTNHVST